MSLDFGRKLEYLERTHEDTRRTCTLHLTRHAAPVKNNELLNDWINGPNTFVMLNHHIKAVLGTTGKLNNNICDTT